MKKAFILSLVMMALPLGMFAQDDLYFTPSKKTAKDQKTEQKSEEPTYYSGINRSVDEYNRRGKIESYYQKIGTDSLGNDIIEFHQGNGEYELSDSIAVYPGSVTYDDGDDYAYSRQMSRFDGYLGYYPWYDPYDWGYWGYPWNRWGWYGPYYTGYWGWYDPWYDPWYYSWCYPYRYYYSYGWTHHGNHHPGGHPGGYIGGHGTHNHSFDGGKNDHGSNTRFGGTRSTTRSSGNDRSVGSHSNTHFGGTRNSDSNFGNSSRSGSFSNSSRSSNSSFGGSRGSFGGSHGSFGGGSRGSFGGGSRGGGGHFGGRR